MHLMKLKRPRMRVFVNAFVVLYCSTRCRRFACGTFLGQLALSLVLYSMTFLLRILIDILTDESVVNADVGLTYA